jgi:hypothetical protein
LNVLPPNEGLIGVKVMSPAAAVPHVNAPTSPRAAALNAVRTNPALLLVLIMTLAP